MQNSVVKNARFRMSNQSQRNKTLKKFKRLPTKKTKWNFKKREKAGSFFLSTRVRFCSPKFPQQTETSPVSCKQEKKSLDFN